MKFRVLIEQDEDGVFVAQVPSLPGCVSQGTTRSAAIASVQEAGSWVSAPSPAGAAKGTVLKRLRDLGCAARE